MKESSLQFLKDNYQNLHQSLWESQKIAWTVTQMFLPVTLAVVAYLSKEYLLSSNKNKGSILVLLLIITVAEMPLLLWRLIMWMLENLNHQRLRKLRAIEELFEKEIAEKEGSSSDETELVFQYRKFSYTASFGKYRVSWRAIYNFIVILLTLVNILVFLAIYYK